MKLKKKFLILIITISTLIGGTQVYAATVLGTNVVSLLSNGIISIKNYFTGTVVNNEINKLNDKYTNSIDDYSKEKANEAVIDLQNHTTSELNRANKELDTYVSDMKDQVNNEYNNQIKKSKEEITSAVNGNISNIKSNLDKELEKQLQNELQLKIKELEASSQK